MLGYISNSLEDSMLEIHLQSPICGPVSPGPRWSTENLSRKGSKEGSHGGGWEKTPQTWSTAKKHWLKWGIPLFLLKTLIWIYLAHVTLSSHPPTPPKCNYIKKRFEAVGISAWNNTLILSPRVKLLKATLGPPQEMWLNLGVEGGGGVGVARENQRQSCALESSAQPPLTTLFSGVAVLGLLGSKPLLVPLFSPAQTQQQAHASGWCTGIH